MSLTPTQYGNNPFQPGVFAENYLPDQLIAGKEHLITETLALAQQSSVLPRGTLLGRITSSGKLTPCIAPKAVATVTVTSSPSGTLPNGTYTNVALADNSSSGAGAIGTVTVASGAVSSVTITSGGGGYAVGDTLYIPKAAITGATGNGVVTVATLTADTGSYEPYGVLIDTSDATGGDISVGVYVKGEFNVNRMTIDPSWGNSPSAQFTALDVSCRGVQLYLKLPIDANDPTETNASGV